MDQKFDLWFTEYQTKDMALSCRVKKTLREQTQFQNLAVVVRTSLAGCFAGQCNSNSDYGRVCLS